MASRVNVKFVVILSAVLGLVFIGVATTAVMVVLKSAEDLAAFGDRKMAEQDYAAAEEFYSKAVNKDPTRVDFLLKWRDSLEHKIPTSETEYRDDYTNFSKGILYHLSRLQKDDLATHRELLDLSLRELRHSSFSRAGWENLADITSDILQLFEDGLTAEGDWRVLRRYRGMALLELVRAAPDLEQETIDLARDDLAAAIEADPRDGRASSALAEWYFVRAQNARDEGNDDEAATLYQTASEINKRLLVVSPRDPWGLLKRLHIQIDGAQRSVDPSLTGSDASLALRSALDPLGEELKRTATELAASDLNVLDTNLIGNFLGAGSIIDPKLAEKLTSDLIDTVLAVQPTSATLLLLRSDLLLASRKPQEATEVAQRVMDLPFPTICLDGLLLFEHKKQALVRQANATLMMWQAAEDPTARAPLLEDAKQYRDELANQLPDRSPVLVLVNAKIAAADGDLTLAKRLLEDFNSQTDNRNVEGLKLLGRLAVEIGQLGLAREQFQVLVQNRPGDLSAILALADVESKLKNNQAAIDLYVQAMGLDPTNETAAGQIKILEALSGLGTVEDPIVQALIEAERVRAGSDTELPDPAGAETKLKEAMRRHNNDPRLASSLVNSYMRAGELQEALAVVESSLASHPEHEGLAKLQQALASGDLLTVELAGIDNSAGKEFDKDLARYRVLTRHGNDAQAAEALARAAKTSPLDARLIELQFIIALNAEDFGEAQRLADVAAKNDLDGAQGLSFQARVELRRGDPQKAALTLGRAIEQGVANTETYRLLAGIQNQIGRSADALVSLRSALRLTPNNIPVLNETIRTMIRLNQMEDALNTARGSIKIGQADGQFLNLWLSLEAMVGNRQEALLRRQQIAQRDPSNHGNKLALSSLFIEMQQWDDADRLITELEQDELTLDVAAIRARWSADRGDLDSAQSAFMDYILDLKTREAELNAIPYIVFGKFMLERGDAKTAITALEQARDYQSPDTMHADRALGEAYHMLRQYREAAQAYQRILDAGIDDTAHTVRKRTIDTLINLEQFEEAQALIDQTGSAAQADLQFLLFQADIATAMEDMSKASALLDKAVASFPNEATAYLKRAEHMRSDPRMIMDALADIDRSLQLRPDDWQALRLRALVNFGLHRVDDALNDLIAAVRANMNNKELWASLLTELLRYDRPAEAVALTNDAIQKYPNDISRLMIAGDAFASASLWNRASSYYEQAFRLNKNPTVTGRFIDCLLRTDPPNHRKAMAVLNDSGLDIDSSPPLLTLRARIWAAAGNTANARTDATAALIPLKGNSSSIEGWGRQLGQIFPDHDDLMAYVEDLNETRGDGNWTVFFLADAMLRSEPKVQEGLTLLSGLTTTTEDFDLLSIISKTCYAGAHYAHSAAALRRALEMQPDNVGLNNNLAFTLAEHLGQAQEALEYAHKAVANAPDQARMLDTLGLVQHLAGELDNAEQTFTKGLSAATTTAEKVALNVHFAQLELDRGDTAAARRYAQKAEEGLSLIPTGLADYRNALEELMKSLN